MAMKLVSMRRLWRCAGAEETARRHPLHFVTVRHATAATSLRALRITLTSGVTAEFKEHIMYKQVLMLSAAVAGLALAAAAPAEAAHRGRLVSVQGAGGRGYVAQRSISRLNGDVAASRSLQANNGRGYVQQRSVSREPGQVSASRSLQTNGGAGYVSSRDATWGDGSYSGGATHMLNDGTTFGRSANATRNDDGSISYSATRNRADGTSVSVAGTRP